MKLLRTLLALAPLLPGLALASVVVKGGTSGTNADVDANKRLLVQPGQNTKADAPWSQIRGEIDNYGVSIPSSRRLIVGQDVTLMQDVMIGTTINAGLWQTPITTFAIAQAAGRITLNNAAGVATGSIARLSSQGVFGPLARTPLEISARIIPRNLGVSFVTGEFGLFTASGATAPTDGVYFRWLTNGEFRAYLNFNGAEVASGALSVPTGANGHDFRIVIYGADDAHFFVDNVEVADLSSTVTEPSVILNKNPVTARVYITPSNAALAPQMEISNVNVRYLGGPPSALEHSYGLMQRISGVNPQTFAATGAINHGTALSTLTANTAPAITSIGGDWLAAAPAGATSEFPLFSYLVPAGQRLVVKSISLDTGTYGAAVTTTAHVLQWYVGTGSSTTALNTVDGTDFVALQVRRIPLGQQLFPISTVTTQTTTPIDRNFVVPLVVESGRYFHVILSVPIGTATASQILRGTVFVNGYIE